MVLVTDGTEGWAALHCAPASIADWRRNNGRSPAVHHEVVQPALNVEAAAGAVPARAA